MDKNLLDHIFRFNKMEHPLIPIVVRGETGRTAENIATGNELYRAIVTANAGVSQRSNRDFVMRVRIVPGLSLQK